MSRSAIRRLPWSVLVVASVMTIGLSLPAAGWDPSFTPPPAEPVEVMPPPADGDVAVRFSVAPTNRDDTDFDVLTRWRSCAVVQDEIDYFPPEAYDIGPAAIGHVTTTADEVQVRLDVAAGPDGKPCDADRLVRVAVTLDEKLGDRSTGAWWKVRAKRADPGSRYVEAWVYQDVCGHYPWSRDTHQMRVAIGDALHVALATTQIGYDEHGIRIEGRAGSGGIATRAWAGKDVYAPVDCQGYGPGTFRLDVRPKLKKWTLYDAGVFPPKRRWPLEQTPGDPAS